MQKHPKIAAVVVLYNPDFDVMDNVLSWIGQVDTVFAVDNSEGEISPAVSAIAALKKVTIIRNMENLGIATALNIGAEKAMAGGYDWLLTMDQDSKAAPDMIVQMLKILNHIYVDKIGVISPFHLTKSSGLPPLNSIYKSVMTPMTSGCLLNLNVYKIVGSFRDDFFIDFVDNEYSLRLRKFGFELLQANNAVLQHSVGDTKKYGPFVATNHSPLRRYYKTRNRFQVFREYASIFPCHCLFDLVRLTKEIASIVLFEDYKFNKLQMMWRGFMDFMKGVTGRYKRVGELKL